MADVNLTEVLTKALIEHRKDINTSIPGNIISFNPENQTAQVQIGILIYDRNGGTDTPAPIIEVPVEFPGSHDFVIEHDIQPGTEGVIEFSQRCIDGWFQTGGVAANPISRFFDKSDAIFRPTIRSLPNVFPSWSGNGIKLRNRSGGQYIWLKDDGTCAMDNGSGTVTVSPSGACSMSNGSGHVNLLADGSVNINGVIITTDGKITASEVTTGTVSMSSHKHTGVTTGSGQTGGPV